MQRRFARLVGRGTTALYVALRALCLVSGSGEIILPDLLCSTVLDAVLLAGFAPRFADVIPDRFALDPDSVKRSVTAKTRGVIVAHLFGYVSDVEPVKQAAPGIPLIEDAVQGLGGVSEGRNVGSLGDIAITSFHPTKMIPGFGGLVATDDPDLWSAMQRVSLVETIAPYADGRYRHYLPQLGAIRDLLIRPFDSSSANIAQIRAGWANLKMNVARRNAKAAQIRESLADLPLMLPEVRSGDAIWRYTFAAPSRASAAWILRHLQMAGLNGSHLYPSLSDIYAPGASLHSVSLAPRLVNLWVDDGAGPAEIARAIDVIRAVTSDHQPSKS